MCNTKPTDAYELRRLNHRLNLIGIYRLKVDDKNRLHVLAPYNLEKLPLNVLSVKLNDMRLCLYNIFNEHLSAI